jgi:transmembrane protein EpsG
MIFCAYPYLRERKFGRYLLFVILGATFHVTALIMIPIYFLVAREITWKNTVLIIVISFVLRYSYDFVFDLMGAVKDKEFGEYAYLTADVNILRIIVAFAPIILFLFIPPKSRKGIEHKENQIDLSMNIVLINAALMFATMGSTYLARVGIYTSIFFPLVIPEITKKFDKETRSIFEFVIIVCYMVYFLYGIYAQKLGYIFFFQR